MLAAPTGTPSPSQTYSQLRNRKLSSHDVSEQAERELLALRLLWEAMPVVAKYRLQFPIPRA
jgi:hypothetical protein